MPLERKKVEKSLKKKGFYIQNGDHKYFFFETEPSIFTKTSHGSKYKTLDDSLTSAMAKQIHLSNSEFRDFVSCKITQETYEEQLKKKGLI